MTEDKTRDSPDAMTEEAEKATDSPYYRSAFWSAFVGHIKGLANGLVSGGLLGTLAGAIIAPIAVFALGAGIAGFGAWASVGLIAAGFAGAGMATGAAVMGLVGTVAGAAAGVQDEKERRREKALNVKTGKTPTIEQQAPEHHKLFSWKIAAIGIGIGALLGVGLALSGGAGAVLGAFGLHAVEGITAAGINWGVVGLSALSMSAVGATFGVGCQFFQKIGVFTDHFFDSKNEGITHCATGECHKSAKLTPSHASARAEITDKETAKLQQRTKETIPFTERLQGNPGIQQAR